MKRRLYVLFFLIMTGSVAWSQSRQVTGTVRKQTSSENLAGVSVTVKGTGTAASTNNEGKFSIAIPDRNNVILVFSSIGYKKQEITVGTESVLEVNLQEEASTLNDVVVVGYQVLRRRDLTGSVSSVNARQLRDIPINSASQALAGRLAGVQVTGSEGSPNAQVAIRIRGGGSITQDNSPLYIIDGVQVENGLNAISPQDIESVDVLKDASTTAIYGARGANGVVIITTKGGRNTKPTITYNGLVGYRKLANKLEVMHPRDFVLYQYERSRGSSADSTSFAKRYGTTYDTLQNYINTPFVDWQEEMFGRRALMQTHNISLSGGSQTTTYNLSLTSNTEEGIMQGSDFDRKLVSFKFDHNFTPTVKVGFNTRFNHTTVNGAGTSSPGSSSTNNLRQSVKYRPLIPPGQELEDYDPDYANETNANSLSLVNPILLNQAQYRKNLSNILNLSAYVNINLTKFLTFRTTAGYDLTNDRQQAFDDSITNNSKQNGASRPMTLMITSNRTTINNSNVLTFSNATFKSGFNKRNAITLLAGHEIYQVRSERYNVETRYFPLGISPQRALGNLNLGDPTFGAQPKPTSEVLPSNLLSFFSRLNYTFDNKYLLSLSLRADGSTKFAKGNKWGYFPSGSFAWRISNEKFMENLSPAVNDLKVRVSYGESGNNRIDDFLYLTQFNTSTQYGLNDQLVTGFQAPTLANENLTWETTVSQNLGLDASVLNNRLSFSLDIYKNITEDLLVNVPVPTTSGYTRQLQNVGSTMNKGIEIQVNGTPVSSRNFNWTANFNISFNKNTIRSLGQFQKSYLENSGWAGSNSPADYLVRVGAAIGSIWGLQTDGFYSLDDFNYNTTTGVYTLKTGVPTNQAVTAIAPQPGGIKFKDIAGPPDASGKLTPPDGKVDEYDRTIIGNASPKFFGGLNQQFTYRNFDLNVFLNFQSGNDVYNANKLEFTSGYTPNSNLLAIMNNRWRTVDAQGVPLQRVVLINNVQTVVGANPATIAAANQNASIWLPITTSTSFIPHSWAIEDGSFIRLNNITLGYTLPASLTKRARVERLRFYVTASNLAVITNYSGYDPEVSTRRNNPVTPGVDYSAYPRSRSYILGLNLSL